MAEIYQLRETIEELTDTMKLIGDSLWPGKSRKWSKRSGKTDLCSWFLGW